MVQATAYGATIIRVDGSFDDALAMLLGTISGLPGFSGMNSVNPYRLEGQKTAAFEMYEQLGFSVPDDVVLPVGNAGNISAIWKGFKELKAFGITEKLPRMVGVQAEGASPYREGVLEGERRHITCAAPKHDRLGDKDRETRFGEEGARGAQRVERDGPHRDGL